MNTQHNSKEWEALKAHQKTIATESLQEWFDQDPQRFTRFSLQFGDILLDYSKNRVTTETIQLLNNLAHASQLKQKIDDLFSGLPVNITENRSALHTALRNLHNDTLLVNNHNIMSDIRENINQMRIFSEKIRQRTWLGYTGKPITDIINIGIGGSHLGPLMAIHALADFVSIDLKCHFISNIDSAHIHAVLEKINPESTLFIISSKSFTTLETITNANTLKKWLQNKLGAEAIANHFIAITAAPALAMDFGIPQNNIFPLWEWVGGRYSVWSSIGLPLALLIGMDNFLLFLQGAHEMDQHFCQTDFAHNMPVIMALLGIWYINFFESTHHAVVPYSHRLHYLRMHLQQLDMESNGKMISQQGSEVNYRTCPVIFGDQGCNGQHAFHQLLHQGKHLIPVDFILVGKNNFDFDYHHDILVASGLSQAQALMRGKSYTETYNELKTSGLSENECAFLAKHKSIPGNRPSNILFLKSITPRTIGALIALYEHKTFVQGVIWQINSFDQWGVELGKKLLPAILNKMTANKQHHENKRDNTIKQHNENHFHIENKPQQITTRKHAENKSHNAIEYNKIDNMLPTDSSTEGLIHYYNNLKVNS